MEMMNNIKEAVDIVSSKKFEVSFYSKDIDETLILFDKKKMSIPEINLYLLSKDIDTLLINFMEID